MALQVPPKPKADCDYQWVALGLYGLIALVALGLEIWVMTASKSVSPVWIVLLAVPVLGFGVAAIVLGREIAAAYQKRESRERRWYWAAVVWERLFYCGSCDRVFDPDTNSHFAPEGVRWGLFNDS